MFKTFSNWKVVVLSILGATTFWFFNALNKNYDARISYPVSFEFNRDSVVIMKPLPKTLKVDVSSGGWNLFKKTFWLTVTPIQIVLENPTEISFYTRSSLLPLVTDQLSQLKVNYLITDTVFIDIEPKKTKKVAFVIDSQKIDLAENYRLTSPVEIDEDSLVLTGPKSFYDTLRDTYEIVIASKGINSDYDRDIDIIYAENDLISIYPEKVNVEFEVDKFIRESINVPVENINFPEDSSVVLQNEEVQIFYTIPESDRGSFEEDDFAVTADFGMIQPKDSTVIAILVYYPEEAIEIQVIPENIRVRNGRR